MKYSRASIWILWTFMLLAALAFADSGDDDKERGRKLRDISLTDYYRILNKYLSVDNATGGSSGNVSLESGIRAEQKSDAQFYGDLVGVKPPDAVATDHYNLLKVLSTRPLVDDWILQQSPKGISLDAGNAYVYRTPEIGLLRNDEASTNCSLVRVAALNRINYTAINCNSAQTPPTNVLGSAVSPVTTMTLMTRGLRPGETIAEPDLSFGYGLIYAKADTDLTIIYENDNPAPFLHNVTVYKNTTGTELKAYQILGQTPAGYGPVVNTLRTKLPAGEYRLVCNVHPTVQQARLVVVP